MKRQIISLLLVLAAISALGQNVPASNPGWLWTINGSGLPGRSFLFGTCHGDGISFTDEEIYSIHGLSEALDEAQTFFFESDMSRKEISDEEKEEIKQLMGKIYKPGPEYMMPEGVFYKPLFDSVAHFNEVNKFMTYKMKDVEYWKKTPGYWCIRLVLYWFSKARMCRSVDSALYEEVTKRGKEIGGLETHAFGMGKLMPMFSDTESIDTLSMKEQAKIVYTFVHSLDNDSVFQIPKLHAVYLENDTSKLQRYFEEGSQKMNIRLEAMGSKGDEAKKAMGEMNDYQNEHLLRERNEAWIPVIKENIAKRPCLIAVGCRHLLSADGLIAMLRREGYRVEPVMKPK
ncbi:MAG: TraB/GumN family protein [Bacteroidaceae bacterium]|nr:TraB/GumN family protein [Bacteroidaceae bacterium]